MSGSDGRGREIDGLLSPGACGPLSLGPPTCCGLAGKPGNDEC
jgi:hypothetical protein